MVSVARTHHHSFFSSGTSPPAADWYLDVQAAILAQPKATGQGCKTLERLQVYADDFRTKREARRAKLGMVKPVLAIRQLPTR
jgi:hypothetical protein